MPDLPFVSPSASSALRAVTWLAAATGLVLTAGAQTSPAPAGLRPEPAANETVTLSPFMVSTDRDVGFVAASSLAGGRLAADLKDTPVAYSVLTREFIDALGLEDLSQAAEWTVGAHQNVDAGANAIFASVGSYSVRGVSGLSRQRNFFPFGITFDSYNLDRFDFARGPNSVLFGTGSIGGAANSVTKQATFGKPIRQLEARIGSWENYRVTTDLNVSNDKLAVRANTLWQDTDGWRNGDYQKKQSAFLTSTLRLTSRTQIRLEGEYGRMEQRSGFTNLNDRISGWDGSTVYGTVPTTTIPAATRNLVGVSQYGADSWVYSQAFGTNDLINFQNSPFTVGANAAGTFVGGRPIVGTGINTVGQSILNQINLPAERFDRAIAGSQFRLPGREFTHYFSNRPTLKQGYRDVALYLNHQFGRSFFVEIAGDYNKETRFGDTTYNRNVSDVLIDVNRSLPGGAPNPNFLKPYFEAAQRYDNIRSSENINARLAAAYLLDTRVGAFKFNLLGGINRSESNLRAWQLSLPFEDDSRLWVGRHFIRYRQYWDQADRSLPEFPREVRVVDPIAGTARLYTPVMVLDTTRPDSISRRNNNFTYGNIAAQAKLLGGRLNLVGAYRRDQYHNSGEVTRAAGDYPAGWNAFDVQWRPAAPADYYNLPAVPARDAAGRAIGGTVSPDVRPRDTSGFRLPQYANDRFRDDFNPPDIDGAVGTYTVGGVLNVTRWLGLSANYSETFNPPGGSVGYDGSLLPPSISKGVDLGLRFNLLGGRLSASLNYYTSKENNAVIGTPAGSQGNFNAIFQANPIGDQSANGRNIRGFADLPIVLRDTIRRNSSGYELDATANLTRQWRLLANVSLAEPLQDNAYPLSIAYWKAREGDFRQILADAGVIIDANNVARVDTSIPSNVASPNATAAANAWNDIRSTFLANLVTQPQLIRGSARITANVFTDYTFRTGWLNGVRLGFGVNYRAKQVIGYRGGDTIVSPTNPNAAIDDPSVDAYTPVYNDSYYVGTATAAYTWRLSRDRRISFNLRVDNLFDDDDVRFFQNGGSATGGTVQRPPNGDVSSPARVATPSLYSYPVPISYSLSARFEW